jgi:hypothetical protein
MADPPGVDHLDQMAYLAVTVGSDAMLRYAETNDISRAEYVEMTNTPDFLGRLQRYNFSFLALPRNKDVVEMGLKAGEARDMYVNGVVPDFMAKKRPEGLVAGIGVVGDGASYVGEFVRLMEGKRQASQDPAGLDAGDGRVGELGSVGSDAQPAEFGGGGGLAEQVGGVAEGHPDLPSAPEAALVSRREGSDEVVLGCEPVGQDDGDAGGDRVVVLGVPPVGRDAGVSPDYWDAYRTPDPCDDRGGGLRDVSSGDDPAEDVRASSPGAVRGAGGEDPG